MAEKEQIFSSKIKYAGIFSFADFYKFCYDWLTEEAGFDILAETKYSEKISGDAKNIDVEWKCSKKVTDYFKYEAKITFKIIGLKKVEVQEGNKKIKTNEGSVEVSVKGTLLRDYEGKFERDAFRKFLRAIYEKWIIYSRILQFEDQLAANLNEFLSQAKAYLDLEGKK